VYRNTKYLTMIRSRVSSYHIDLTFLFFKSFK